MNIGLIKMVKKMTNATTKAQMERYLSEETTKRLLDEIVKLVSADGVTWCGSASELTEHLEEDISPAVLGKLLFKNRETLIDRGVEYSFYRTKSKRYITLEPIKE